MPHRTVSRKIQSPLRREDFQRITGQTNKDCSFSELYFDKFPTPTTFACWKIRFETEVCTCSPFPTEAMHWIKEVEMVESVDDLKSSRSSRGAHGPNFEVLDARSASALNKIVQNTRFKKKGQSGGNESSQRRPFPSRETDRSPDLRILSGHWEP